MSLPLHQFRVISSCTVSVRSTKFLPLLLIAIAALSSFTFVAGNCAAFTIVTFNNWRPLLKSSDSIILSVGKVQLQIPNHSKYRRIIFSSIKMNQDSLYDEVRKGGESSHGAPINKKSICAPKGTLYISIGPQCSGKTTLLKQIFGKSFHKAIDPLDVDVEMASSASSAGLDITIDDQELVYIQIPKHLFLNNNNTATPSDQDKFLLGLNLLGKTIRQRIMDPSQDELRRVIQRLGGILSHDEFKSLTLPLKGQQSKSIEEELVEAIEYVMNDSNSSLNDERNGLPTTKRISLPETIDLFIVESIFRPRPLEMLHAIAANNGQNRNCTSNATKAVPASSALDAALHLLQSHATSSITQTNNQSSTSRHPFHAPLAWGNTNTRPREYTSALEAAERSGRPVEFIVFSGMEACEMIRDHVSRRDYHATMAINRDEKKEEIATSPDVLLDGSIDELLCLPKLSQQTLLRRNLQRFLQTGKYIPCNAIAEAMVRTDSLLASAAAEAKKEYEMNCRHFEGTEGKIEVEEMRDTKMSSRDAKFRLDYELTKLAGYRLNPDRTVSILQKSNAHSRGMNNRKRGGYQTSSSGRSHGGSRDARGAGGRGSRRNENQNRLDQPGTNNYNGGNNDNYNKKRERNNKPSGNSYESGRGGSYSNKYRSGRETSSYDKRAGNNNYEGYDASKKGSGSSQSGRGWNSHNESTGNNNSYNQGRNHDHSSQRYDRGERPDHSSRGMASRGEGQGGWGFRGGRSNNWH